MTGTSQPTAGRHPACAHHAQAAPQPPQRPPCACQGLLRPRRMHALGGLWMASFLVAHLAIALCGLRPPLYGRITGALHAALAHLPGAVFVAIFLPLLFQSASGLYLLRREGMRYGVKKCNRGGKLRFFLQRATGLAILAFTLFHVATFYGWLGHAAAPFQPGAGAFRSTVAGFHAWGGAAALCGLLGIWAAAFHAGNGAWSGGAIWGLATAPESRRCWGYVCIAVAAAFLLAGTLAWYAFTLNGPARGL